MSKEKSARNLTDVLALDARLDEEQRALKKMLREFSDRELRPKIGDWFESGEIPAREIAREVGSLGILGMHLDGYGCAGSDALSYGLACLS